MSIFSKFNQIRKFSLSPRNQASKLPIFVLIFLTKKISKLAAIVFGRSTQKWWRSLPENNKLNLRQRLRNNRVKLTAGSGLLVGGVGLFCYSSLEEAPITNRKRFIFISKKHREEINYITEINLEKKYSQLFLNDEKSDYFKRVDKIVNKILLSNKELDCLDNIQWKIKIIKNDHSKNAFVTENGSIYVYTGLLNYIEQDDILAFVLGHEISHALLRHSSEKLTHAHLLDSLLILISILIWSILPEILTAGFVQYVTDELSKLLLQSAYSRSLEIEADKVGLLLATKSCYDIRGVHKFWLDINSDQNKTNKSQLFSSHPSDKTRSDIVKSIIPQMLELREKCNCPKLF